MADGKLYITISDNRGGTGLGQLNQDVSSTQASDKRNKNLLGEYAKHEMMHLVKQTANNMVSFGVSQIGFLYGDTTKQQHIQLGINVVNKLTNIGMAAFSGFTMTGGNPIGALVGAGVAVVNQVFSGLQEIHYAAINNNRRNYEIDMLRQRAGLDNLNNNSRTGV